MNILTSIHSLLERIYASKGIPQKVDDELLLATLLYDLGYYGQFALSTKRLLDIFSDRKEMLNSLRDGNKGRVIEWLNKKNGLLTGENLHEIWVRIRWQAAATNPFPSHQALENQAVNFEINQKEALTILFDIVDNDCVIRGKDPASILHKLSLLHRALCIYGIRDIEGKTIDFWQLLIDWAHAEASRKEKIAGILKTFSAICPALEDNLPKANPDEAEYGKKVSFRQYVIDRILRNSAVGGLLSDEARQELQEFMKGSIQNMLDISYIIQKKTEHTSDRSSFPLIHFWPLFLKLTSRCDPNTKSKLLDYIICCDLELKDQEPYKTILSFASGLEIPFARMTDLVFDTDKRILPLFPDLGKKKFYLLLFVLFYRGPDFLNFNLRGVTFKEFYDFLEFYFSISESILKSGEVAEIQEIEALFKFAEKKELSQIENRIILNTLFKGFILDGEKVTFLKCLFDWIQDFKDRRIAALKLFENVPDPSKFSTRDSAAFRLYFVECFLLEALGLFKNVPDPSKFSLARDSATFRNDSVECFLLEAFGLFKNVPDPSKFSLARDSATFRNYVVECVLQSFEKTLGISFSPKAKGVLLRLAESTKILLEINSINTHKRLPDKLCDELNFLHRYHAFSQNCNRQIRSQLFDIFVSRDLELEKTAPYNEIITFIRTSKPVNSVPEAVSRVSQLKHLEDNKFYLFLLMRYRKVPDLSEIDVEKLSFPEFYFFLENWFSINETNSLDEEQNEIKDIENIFKFVKGGAVGKTHALLKTFLNRSIFEKDRGITFLQVLFDWTQDIEGRETDLTKYIKNYVPNSFECAFAKASDSFEEYVKKRILRLLSGVLRLQFSEKAAHFLLGQMESIETMAEINMFNSRPSSSFPSERLSAPLKFLPHFYRLAQKCTDGRSRSQLFDFFMTRNPKESIRQAPKALNRVHEAVLQTNKLTSLLNVKKDERFSVFWFVLCNEGPDYSKAVVKKITFSEFCSQLRKILPYLQECDDWKARSTLFDFYISRNLARNKAYKKVVSSDNTHIKSVQEAVLQTMELTVRFRYKNELYFLFLFNLSYEGPDFSSIAIEELNFSELYYFLEENRDARLEQYACFASSSKKQKEIMLEDYLPKGLGFTDSQMCFILTVWEDYGFDRKINSKIKTEDPNRYFHALMQSHGTNVIIPSPTSSEGIENTHSVNPSAENSISDDELTAAVIPKS